MGRDGKRKPDRDHGAAAKRTKYFSTVRLLAHVLFTADIAEHGAAVAFHFGAQNQNAALPKNTRGFLISCIGYKERLAAQEAINLLTEVICLYGPQAAVVTASVAPPPTAALSLASLTLQGDKRATCK